MIETKLWLFGSGFPENKQYDYTQNIMSGMTYTDDLTEVLDVCELTLVGITREERFAPSTKFILELWQTDGQKSKRFMRYSLCVANDVVSKPQLSDDHYFNHSITFNEASVLAQGRIVDNCSETYKLKDVNLDKSPSFDPTAPTKPKKTQYDANTGNNNGYHTIMDYFVYRETDYRLSRQFKFVFGGEYGLTGSIDDWKALKQNTIVPVGGTLVELPIPLIATYFGKNGEETFDTHPNFCSVVCTLYSKSRLGSGDFTVEQSFFVNPSTSNATENDWQADWRFAEICRTPNDYKGYGANRVDSVLVPSGEFITASYRTRFKKYANFDNVVQNRKLSFTAMPDKIYKVEVTMANLPTNTIPQADLLVNILYAQREDDTKKACYSSICELKSVLGIAELKSETYYCINDQNPRLQMEFTTYAESATGEIMFHQAPPLSAYDLFVDAQLKTEQRYKEVGTYIKDSELTYYCNEDDINILKNTQIVESSFHQKNFWEVLLDIGKYIHAIPYITFDGNRFLVSWEYLGRTDIQEDNATPISIFNSSSIESYVSAVNSYVNNAIQLGGEVEEWVAPKSESQDYLCYNDVACIKSSKPIIEMLEFGIRAIRNNSKTPQITILKGEQDLTEYIYENSIYEILDIVETYNKNKGYAVYYNLGEDVIRGLNYQLPAVNAGDDPTQYAIKRIIAKAYGESTSNVKDIIINDFIFHLRYRTKESVRSEQSRPDLRKYLMASSLDNIPQHKQFSNQQDISVDSIKLGNKIYGELIKTGNNEYSKTEWVDNLWDIKQAGYLIRIGADLYYASKIQTTYYQDHAVCEITYSKDYNQLSEIIGIPSEPRFYEISERNIIDRQKNLDQYLILGTSRLTSGSGFINGTDGFDKIKDIILGNAKYPKSVITQFKNDEDLVVADIPNANKHSVELMHPLSAYSMRNTLTLKWGMVDNFSAGDRVEKAFNENNPLLIVDKAYNRLIPTQYCDQMGRTDLIDFAVINEETPYASAQNYPLSPYRLEYASSLKDYRGQCAKIKPYSDQAIYNPIDTNTMDNITLTSGMSLVDSNNSIVISYSGSSQIGAFFYVEGDSTMPSAIYRLRSITSSQKVFERFLTSYNDDFATIRNSLAIGSAYAPTPLFASKFGTSLFGSHRHGIALVKDNRERIQFNLNLQMLTDSDRFVLSGILWQQEKGGLKVALLNKEVNKISTEFINESDILVDENGNKRVFNLTTATSYLDITIDITSTLLGQDLTDVKAIAIIRDEIPVVGVGTQRWFVMARNVSDLTNEEKRANWYISQTETIGRIQ